ncbi:MAG TPA: hypothetical protein PL131_11050 [Methylotenera sp.]|nr:hypothetical protein [Methylotenera sp.]HPH06403.1 hypothetical protein [Methylotenera sp.]HPN01821.1 hypothetical protein [Methylotenera sp.]
MKNTKNTRLIICSLALIAGFSGCSKNDENSTNKEAEKNAVPNLTDALSQKNQAQVAVSVLPKGDTKIPLEQYTELSDGNDVMYAYYALNAKPIDYEAFLSSYTRTRTIVDFASINNEKDEFEEYRKIKDAFKKQDQLKVLIPKIDQKVEAAKNDRYKKILMLPNLQPYDFNTKTFSDKSFTSESSLRIGNNFSNNITLTNAENFKDFKVEDESKAREIETGRSAGKLQMMVYIYLQDAGSDSNQTRTVKAQVMKVSLQNKEGVELYSQ